VFAALQRRPRSLPGPPHKPAVAPPPAAPGPARRERPRGRRAAECSQQFPPSDGDCHTPLPCARCVKGRIPCCERTVPNSAAPGTGGGTPGTGGIGAAPDPRVRLDFKSAASKRKESAWKVNVVFNHDFLEVANENFNAHSPTARHGDRDTVQAPGCTVDMLCS